MDIDSNQHPERQGVHTKVLKQIPSSAHSGYLTHIFLFNLSPQKSRLNKGKGQKATLELSVSGSSRRSCAAPEHPLGNWINVFEVALIHFALPPLPPGLAGTVPTPAASQMLRALQCPESSSNKQQFLGHCNTVALCCFVEHQRSDWRYYLRSIPTTGPTDPCEGKN